MAACLQGTACKFDPFVLHDAGDIHGSATEARRAR